MQTATSLGTDRAVIGYDEIFAATVQNMPRVISVVPVGAPQSVLSLKYWDDTLAPKVVNSNANVANPNETTIVLQAGQGASVPVNAVLVPAGSEENILVTNVSTDTLTVVRGVGSSTKAALTAGQVLRILSRGTKEGDSGHAGSSTAGELRENHFQKFHETFAITGTAMVVNAHGIRAEDRLGVELRTALQNLAYDINNQLIMGAGAQAMSTSQAGFMRGIYHSIKQAGGTVTNVAGALTEAALNGAVRRIIAKGGMPNSVITNPANITTIASAVANRMQWVNSDKNAAGYAVTNFLAQTGERLSFYLDPNVDPKHAIVCDMSKVQLVPRRPLEATPLAKTGDKQEYQLVTELSLQYKNAGETAEILGGLT